MALMRFSIATFVLTGNDQACGKCDAIAESVVDALIRRGRRPVHVDLQVLGFDVDLHFCGSNKTATVAAEVWMCPEASVVERVGHGAPRFPLEEPGRFFAANAEDDFL